LRGTGWLRGICGPARCVGPLKAPPKARVAAPTAAALVLPIALLFLLVACAGSPGAMGDAGATAGKETYGGRTESPRGIRELSFGWFESRFEAERTGRLVEEGSDLAIPYVGGKGDPDAVRAYLDAAAEAGLDVALQIPGDFVREGDADSITAWVERFRDHPAVRLWYLFDEPDVNGLSPPLLAEAARLLRDAGGGRPVAVTFYSPRDALRLYKGSFDLLWLNYYPVFRGLPEFFGIAWGGFAARVEAGRRAALESGAGFGMILQAYGRSDSGENQFNRRLPSAAELDYMLWTSLAASPSHILFWARYRSGEAWLEEVFLPTVNPVIRIAAGGIEALESADFAPGPAGARLFRFRTAGGEYLALICGSRRARKAKLAIPEGFVARPLLLPPGAEVSFGEGNDLVLSARAYSVLLFGLAR